MHARDAVVLVGRVTVDSGEGWGKGPARLLVEEAVQDSPKVSTEVEVQTMAGTSCYRRLVLGERYVIISHKREGSDGLYVGGCSPSFALKGNEHILDAIRNQAKGGPSRIVGWVWQSQRPYQRDGGVPGVTVTAATKETKVSGNADADGRFDLRALPPGIYSLDLSKPGFLPDVERNIRHSSLSYSNQREAFPPGSVLLGEGSCTVVELSMWPNGRIRGTVRGPSGQPLGGVTVGAYGFDREGERESSPLRTTKSDASGIYLLDRLPGADYIVGVNAHSYKDLDAYPPTVYATGDSKEPTRIHVVSGEEFPGVDLVLKNKREPAVLRVRVVGPDGAPVKEAVLRLDNLEGQERLYGPKTNEEGWAEATIYVGEQYIVRVIRMESKARGYRQYEGSVRIRGEASPPPVTVVLTLTAEK